MFRLSLMKDEIDNSKINHMAKALVLYVFRNSIIEDYHAKGFLTNEQMKAINIDCVNRMGILLKLIRDNQLSELGAIMAFLGLQTREWDDIDFSLLDKLGKFL